MPYYVFLIVAIAIHITINVDTLRRKKTEGLYGLGTYKLFLISIFAFYISDLLWGIFDANKLAIPLYVDTFIYFVLMGLTVFLWTRFAIRFIDMKNIFGRVVEMVGLAFLLAEVVILVINVFKPILFEIDLQTAVYTTHPARDIMLWIQITMYLLMFVVYLIISFRSSAKIRRRILAISAFSLTCAALIFAQIFDPYLPFYSMAILVGVCVLHAFMVNDIRHDMASALDALDESIRLEKVQEEALDDAMHLMRTDALTGVHSRHAYVEAEQHYDTLIAKKECSPFAVAVFDLNGLKTINDTKGHDAGDRYIQDSVKLISGFFPLDSIYRFGGDEFVVIIENEDPTSIKRDHSAFMSAVEDNARLDDKPVISSGISFYKKEADNTFRAVFQRADKVMYGRKEYLKKGLR